MTAGKFAFVVFSFLVGLQASAASLTATLNEADATAQVVARVGTSLRDNNISTGTSDVTARRLTAAVPTDKSQREKLTLDLFKAAFRASVRENFPANEKVALGSAPFSEAIVAKVALALAVGNAFDLSNKENITPLQRSTWAILRALPVDAGTLVGTASARITDSSDGTKRRISYFYFLNPQTKKLVQFFSIEGTM